MSLAVVIKGPEGVVLAADSRITLQALRPNQEPLYLGLDNATKLLTFSKPNTSVAAVTYGEATIGGPRTAHSFVPELELYLKAQFLEDEQKYGSSDADEPGRLTVEAFAKELGEFYGKQWAKVTPPDYRGPGMSFVIAGYDAEQPYGKVLLLNIPNQPNPEPRNEGEQFGMTWGGQPEIVSRLIHGHDPLLGNMLKGKLNLDDQAVAGFVREFRNDIAFAIPYAALPLQDCIDLATFLIRGTIFMQSVGIGTRGVGGPIDVAVITRTEGLRFIQQKKLHGE